MPRSPHCRRRARSCARPAPNAPCMRRSRAPRTPRRACSPGLARARNGRRAANRGRPRLTSFLGPVAARAALDRSDRRGIGRNVVRDHGERAACDLARVRGECDLGAVAGLAQAVDERGCVDQRGARIGRLQLVGRPRRKIVELEHADPGSGRDLGDRFPRFEPEARTADHVADARDAFDPVLHALRQRDRELRPAAVRDDEEAFGPIGREAGEPRRAGRPRAVGVDDERVEPVAGQLGLRARDALLEEGLREARPSTTRSIRAASR